MQKMLSTGGRNPGSRDRDQCAARLVGDDGFANAPLGSARVKPGIFSSYN